MSDPDIQFDQDQLLAALDQCVVLYREGGHSRLASMFHAVRICTIELRRLGATDEHVLPLTALLHALDQLNHGKTAGVLRPRKGSPPSPDRVEGAFTARRAYALLVEHLIYISLGNRQRRKSEERAAQILAANGFETRLGRPLTKDVLRQWRSDLTDSEPEHELLREVFSDLKSRIPPHVSREDARSLAEKIARKAASHPSFHLS